MTGVVERLDRISQGECCLPFQTVQERGEPDASGDPELLKDVAQVGADGACGAVELPGDRNIVVALCGQDGDGAFGG